MINITDRKQNIYGELEGKFFCKCLNKNISIQYDNNLSIEYIDRSVQHFNYVYSKLLNDLCKYTVFYCKDTMQSYPDVEYNDGLYNLGSDLDILHYIEFVDLKVGKYNNNIGLNLSGSCDWSEERCLQWMILENTIIYVGPWDDLEVWTPNLDKLFFNYCTRKK